MARNGPATGRRRHLPRRLPAVEAAARRLEALLSDRPEDLVALNDAPFADDDDDESGNGNSPLFDLEGREFGCTLALFHPPKEPYAGYARNWIIPLLDGYGRVIIGTDSAADTPALVGGDTPHLGKRCEDAAWRQNVGDLVDTLDVAVVDASHVTDDVLWEIEACYGRLPSVRVIVIAHAINEGDLQSHANRLFERLDARAVNRGTEPLLAYAGDEALGHFAVALHVRMREIVIASIAAYETALDTAEETNDLPAMMGLYCRLGEAAYNLGSYRAAMDWLHLALVVAGALKDRAAMQRMHLRLQAAAAAAGDDAQWLESFEALGEIQGWRTPQK